MCWEILTIRSLEAHVLIGAPSVSLLACNSCNGPTHLPDSSSWSGLPCSQSICTSFLITEEADLPSWKEQLAHLEKFCKLPTTNKHSAMDSILTAKFSQSPKLTGRCRKSWVLSGRHTSILFKGNFGLLFHNFPYLKFLIMQPNQLLFTSYYQSFPVSTRHHGHNSNTASGKFTAVSYT